MTRADQFKLAAVLLVTAISIWYLVPSYRYFSMTPQQRDAMPAQQLAELRKNSIHLGLDLQGGMHVVLEVDRSRLAAAEAKDAPERAMEIIRNRVDQFGVAEPLIQREGEDRIVVQLPGLTDPGRAKELIGKTALLEFKLVRTPEELNNLYTRLDTHLAARGVRAPGDSAGRGDAFTRHLMDRASGFVVQEDVPTVQALLATPGVDSVIAADDQMLWGEPGEILDGRTGRRLYLVKRQAEMTGSTIQSATPQIGLKSTDPSGWGVTMKLTSQGAGEFARVTGNNVGRQLAIVLDNVVSSAPNIEERIPGGSASITGGSFTAETAKDLAIVLRAGALPAPVNIIEERTVGPSLGSDSIQQGLTAGLVGTVLVVVFMAVYYQLSGFIAIGALALNLLYLIGAMVFVPLWLGGVPATLTLPGIAGIVLTIGMAVDANVLIFERIREELRNQKTVRESVRLGYDRAFRTILDANVTTLISALFLFQFGTGPIKGFAVTLSIGLIANMFTAVLFTRMIYDFWLDRANPQRLSI